MAKKWFKLKQSRKPHICGIRGLRVKPNIVHKIKDLEEINLVLNTAFELYNKLLNIFDTQ